MGRMIRFAHHLPLKNDLGICSQHRDLRLASLIELISNGLCFEFSHAHDKGFRALPVPLDFLRIGSPDQESFPDQPQQLLPSWGSRC